MAYLIKMNLPINCEINVAQHIDIPEITSKIWRHTNYIPVGETVYIWTNESQHRDRNTYKKGRGLHARGIVVSNNPIPIRVRITETYSGITFGKEQLSNMPDNANEVLIKLKGYKQAHSKNIKLDINVENYLSNLF